MKIIYDPKIQKEINFFNKKDLSRIIKVVDLFEDYGFQISGEYLKKITKEIWELRAGRYRLLFGVHGQFGIVVNLFQKKTQKTPIKEIKLAIYRFNQYEK